MSSQQVTRATPVCASSSMSMRRGAQSCDVTPYSPTYREERVARVPKAEECGFRAPSLLRDLGNSFLSSAVCCLPAFLIRRLVVLNRWPMDRCWPAGYFMPLRRYAQWTVFWVVTPCSLVDGQLQNCRTPGPLL
jgi:hypothetical protein